MLYELARLQIDERLRETDREAQARLARPDRSHSPKLFTLLRIARSRRRIIARTA